MSFKSGDRVRYVGDAEHSDFPAIRESKTPGTVQECSEDYLTVPVMFDGYRVTLYVSEGSLAAVEPSRPLVGPAPKEKQPHFLAPFKAEGDSGCYFVTDAEGDPVIEILDISDAASDFAKYVAEALNARVFSEE